MPTDLVKRLNLDLLYPPFLEKALALLANCRAQGADYIAYSGFRPFAEQFQLHQAYITGKGGIAAPAGLSAHQYGLAIDVAFDADKVKPGLQPLWEREKYELLGEEATKLGLIWGGAFKDWAHVQWPHFVNGAELGPLRTEWIRISRGPQTGQQRAALQSIWKSHVDVAGP